MLQLFTSVWALLVGMALIMIGNGMQSTLIGVRGTIEGFSTLSLSVISAGYFLGFLVGSRIASVVIRKVGHVRTFAALGSLMSAGLIAFPVLTDPVSWTLLRVLLGFCMSGIYVTAESWLNDRATNTTRGSLLSSYVVAQMIGLIIAQFLIGSGNAAGSTLFILSSILVSIAFTPMLLSAGPLPTAEAVKGMSLRELFGRSPTSTIGTLLLGTIFAGQLGMAPVYGAQIGLNAVDVSAFVASFFVGSLLVQFPVGWLSDVTDRRILILSLAALGALASGFGFVLGDGLVVLLVAGFISGGAASPLYSLLIAYMNDFLEREDMPAAASGIVFIYGVGSVAGPLMIGPAMEIGGPRYFWAVLAGLFAVLTAFVAWRITKRTAPIGDDSAYVNVLPTASTITVEAVYELYDEAATEAAAEQRVADEESGGDASASAKMDGLDERMP